MEHLFKHKHGTNYKTFHCPICNIDIQELEKLRTDSFLKNAYNEKALWMANMITHYRYGHISSWDNLLRKRKRAERKYRQDAIMNAQLQIQEVTERAKRQIIRACADYMREHDIKGSDIEYFAHNDDKTLELAHKMLDGQLTLF